MDVCSPEAALWYTADEDHDQPQDLGDDGTDGVPSPDSNNATMDTQDAPVQFDEYEIEDAKVNTQEGRFFHNYNNHLDEMKERFEFHCRGDPNFFYELGTPVLLNQMDGWETVICWEDYQQFARRKNNRKRLKKRPIEGNTVVLVAGPVRTHDDQGEFMTGSLGPLEQMCYDHNIPKKDHRYCYQYVKIVDPLNCENRGWVATRNCVPVKHLTHNATYNLPPEDVGNVQAPAEIDTQGCAGPVRFDARGNAVESKEVWTRTTLKNILVGWGIRQYMRGSPCDTTPTAKVQIVHRQAQILLLQTHEDIKGHYEIAKKFTPDEIKKLGLNKGCMVEYMTQAFLDVDDLVDETHEDSGKRTVADRISDEEFRQMIETNKWGKHAAEIQRLKEMAMEYITAVEGSDEFDVNHFERVGRTRRFITAEDVKKGDESHGRCLKVLRTLIRKKVRAQFTDFKSTSLAYRAEVDRLMNYFRVFGMTRHV